MSKSSQPRRLDAKSALATNERLRTSPRKLNLVAGLIRGKNVVEALQLLTFSQRRIAGDVKKVLQSAIANAENNHALDVDKLFVREAFIGKDITMKRAAHGPSRGHRGMVRKEFSKIKIIVSERDGADSKKTKTAEKSAAKKTEAAKPATKTTKPAAKKAAKAAAE